MGLLTEVGKERNVISDVYPACKQLTPNTRKLDQASASNVFVTTTLRLPVLVDEIEVGSAISVWDTIDCLNPYADKDQIALLNMLYCLSFVWESLVISYDASIFDHIDEKYHNRLVLALARLKPSRVSKQDGKTLEL